MPVVYTPIPLEEDSGPGLGRGMKRVSSRQSIINAALVTVLSSIVAFIGGFFVGQLHLRQHAPQTAEEKGHLPQAALFPFIPTRRVTFEFPTKFEDTGPEGDKVWDDLMPVGRGFIRVPYPRIYAMPPSEPIKEDLELAEVYSLSVTHQLHCLAVLRDVIKKYEKRDKSRYAGDGHEYHCLDYIRQGVLCAGDTTLDYADDKTFALDGSVTRYGFTGANSTHQCRDWDTIRAFAENHRSNEMTGIAR